MCRGVERWQWCGVARRDLLAPVASQRLRREVTTVTHKQRREVFAHADVVTSVAFHPTQPEMFASGGFDKKIRLWHVGII